MDVTRPGGTGADGDDRLIEPDPAYAEGDADLGDPTQEWSESRFAAADRVREMLADLPEPVAMPESVKASILAALAAEQQSRADTQGATVLAFDRGPREAGATTLPGETAANRSLDRSTGDPAGSPAGDLTRPAGSPARRDRTGWLRYAAVAAVVVAVGGGGVIALTNGFGRPVTSSSSAAGAAPQVERGLTSAGETPPQAFEQSAPSAGTPKSGSVVGLGDGAIHIQLDGAAYTRADLPARARALVAAPGAAVRPNSAEADTAGPIATAAGLRSCLEALGVTTARAVIADLGTFDGVPAAVIVVTGDTPAASSGSATGNGAGTVYAVQRSCTTGAPGLLAGPTPLR